jgi:hypothetical protein
MLGWPAIVLIQISILWIELKREREAHIASLHEMLSRIDTRSADHEST